MTMRSSSGLMETDTVYLFLAGGVLLQDSSALAYREC